MAFVSDLTNLRSQVKTEMARRIGYGSMTAYAGTAYDFPDTPEEGNPVVVEYYNNNVYPVLAVAEGCSWCSAYNYQEMGSIDKRATYICVMHKARALANVYFWNQYYKKLGSNDVFVNHVPDEWAHEIIGKQEIEYLKLLTRRNEYVYN